MKRRIFVALGISQELVDAILNWEESFALTSKDTYSSIRWLKPENLHITLVPPWYESEDNIEKVKGLLDFAPREKFILDYSRITYGPNPKRPRLIWIDGKAPRELTDFRNELHKIFGKKLELRPFLLHLTIGRFREKEFKYFKIKRIDDKFIFKEEVRNLLLMESHLERSGAEYSILGEIDLLLK